jgi:L-threonylcarbamoyladenylate synthase
MPTREEVERAAELIRAGRLVAFPTETVYGLGANALDADTVARIFEAKGRPSTSPLIVHVASARMARDLVVSEWPDAAELLTRKFWPGPLTLVLPKRPAIPDRVTAGLPTVGVRVPRHPLALALIEAAGVPIAAPSANRFTQLSPTTAAHVRDGLGSVVDFILDGGPANVGIESTVLSLATHPPVLLRPGMVLREELENLIGPVITVAATEGPHPAPGLHHRHYSPRTPLFVDVLPEHGRGAWLWWHTDRHAVLSIHMPANAGLYAARLYEVLHRLDAEGLDFIAVERLPEGHEWDGVRDRIRRASATREAADRTI